jgi:hypothetical protein
MLLRMNFAGLGFARRCRDSGINVYLLDFQHRRGEFRRHSSSIEADGEVITWDQIGTPEGLALIRSYVRKTGAEALVTLDELCLLWLARNREMFEPQCRILGPPAGVLEHLLFKGNQLDLSRAAGFRILATWVFNAPDDALQVPPEAYPVCLRPTYPNSTKPAFKAKVVQSPEELRSFLASLASITSPLIGQPFHPGPNLVVHGVRSDTRIEEMRGFLVFRKFAGLALCVKSMPLEPELDSACRKFAELAGVVGAFHYDLLRSDRGSRTYFLEINARMGGTTPKVMCLGYDEPTLALQGFGLMGPEVPAPLKAFFSVSSKRMLLQSVLSNVMGGSSELSYPCNNRWVELALLLREFTSTKDPFISMRDLRGSLWYASRRGEAY